jgi:AAA domain, putative AbiEii toxin, Type IV TA system
MYITSLHYKNYRRFTDLIIRDIRPDARLVILAGPNGVGKSSVFDGMRTWQRRFTGGPNDPQYYDKIVEWPTSTQSTHTVEIDFAKTPADADAARRAIYVRTAYRHEPDFNAPGLSGLIPILDMARPHKMIEHETTVSDNYRQLIGQTVASLYDTANDQLPVRELREHIIGEVRASMANIFDDLLLQGISDPITSGTFYFQKGSAKKWPYKNLGGGEKAAFDLILDMIVKRSAYTDTVYCIDEPETHLNTRIQGRLLEELLRLLPPQCQLWVASHSIGMMREAWRRHEDGDPVVFLDFGGSDFDQPVVLEPVVPDRNFWQNLLDVAVGDLADLVAPREVVIVEGRPKTGKDKGNVEFDARCLRCIFANVRPQAGFLSVGGSNDVENDRLALGEGVRSLVPGASIIRVIDRDDRTDAEMAAITNQPGHRVLSRRDLENYLLDDEIIAKLCIEEGRSEKTQGLIDEKKRLLSVSSAGGNAADDIKAISSDLYLFIKRNLGAPQLGSTKHAFLCNRMAVLITPDTQTFKALESDIFG